MRQSIISYLLAPNTQAQPSPGSQPIGNTLTNALMSMFLAASLSLSCTTSAQNTEALEITDSAVQLASPEPANVVDPQQLNLWRTQYTKALTLLRKSKYKDYLELRKQLDNYALAGYLDYRYQQKFISRVNRLSIDAFALRHDNARLTSRLKRTWFKHLAKQKDWPTLIENYDPGLADTSLKCQYARALYASDKKDIAFSEAKILWLSAKSRPSSCDSIFHLLVKEDGIDNELAWQRFVLAFGERQIQLAKYITRFLNSEYKPLAEQYLALYRTPNNIPDQWQKLNANPLRPSRAKNQLLKRLARANPELAAEFSLTLTNNQPQGDLDSTLEAATLATELKHYLITRHALNDYQTLATLYQQLGSPSDKGSLEWLLRAHIAEGQWQAVINVISQLPDELKQHERWQYWHYRAKSLLGKLNEEEQLAFKAVSQQSSFYGFMTSQLLGLPYSFEPVQYQPSAEVLAALQNNPAIQRAQEHYFHKDLAMARSEWRQASRSFDQTEHIDSAYFANGIAWHHQAIVAAIAAKSWKHYPIRFPDVYAEQFKQQAEKHNYSMQWIYATARQESAFASDAQSGAGAIGLMQLLPTTAKDVARRHGIKYQRKRLFDPEYNIVLGSHYLAEINAKYQNRALVSASYNAGPHRVKKWLSNLSQSIPLDAWIETIRFNETRQYVQNVLSFSLIHSLLYSDSNSDTNSDNTDGQLSFFEPHEQLVKPYEQQLILAKKR